MNTKTADECRAMLGLIFMKNAEKMPPYIHWDFMVSPFSTSSSRETAFKEVVLHLPAKDADECRQLLDRLNELEKEKK